MITLKELTELIINGSSSDVINSTTADDSVTVTYTDVDMSDVENVKKTKKSKSIKIQGLKVGTQNKTDNMRDDDSSTGADVILSEAVTIGYAIKKYVSDLETKVTDLEKKVSDLEATIRRLTTNTQ